MNIKLKEMKINHGNNLNNLKNEIFVDFTINEDNYTIDFDVSVGESPTNHRLKLNMIYDLISNKAIDFKSESFIFELKTIMKVWAEEVLDVITAIDSLLKRNIN